MKKAYSLDYDGIERDIDRLHAVEDILDTLDRTPSHTDLEQMATYILCGKDENGLNAVQRGEITLSDRRYGSFKRKDDKIKSLDEILDNPLQDQLALRPMNERNIYLKKHSTIERPKYDKKGNLISVGDSDVPGMVQLWERIDYLEKVLAANEGRIPMHESYFVVSNAYRLYQLRHQLIDMRRHQYYLKDAYKPMIHFLSVEPPRPQTINWDADTYVWISREEWGRRTANSYLSSISKNIDDYETRAGGAEVKWWVRRHNFDWENPQHIRALINHYSDLYMQLYDKPYSWGRTLLFDLDRYIDMCALSEARQYVLLRHIDNASNATIIQELQQKFGLQYNVSRLNVILTKEIPNAVARTAKKHRLLLETPTDQLKICKRCGGAFPRDTLFFTKNNGRKDGFSSFCKECERQRRIERGEQPENDRRSKDTNLLQVQKN